jgi:hypothetical protein
MSQNMGRQMNERQLLHNRTYILGTDHTVWKFKYVSDPFKSP